MHVTEHVVELLRPRYEVRVDDAFLFECLFLIFEVPARLDLLHGLVHVFFGEELAQVLESTLDVEVLDATLRVLSRGGSSPEKASTARDGRVDGRCHINLTILIREIFLEDLLGGRLLLIAHRHIICAATHKSFSL